MFYHGEKHILSQNKNEEERYKENVDIALKWLVKFTKKNDIVFKLTKHVIFKRKTVDFLKTFVKIKTDNCHVF